MSQIDVQRPSVTKKKKFKALNSIHCFDVSDETFNEDNCLNEITVNEEFQFTDINLDNVEPPTKMKKRKFNMEVAAEPEILRKKKKKKSKLNFDGSQVDLNSEDYATTAANSPWLIGNGSKFEISQFEEKEKNYEDVSAQPVRKKNKKNKEKRLSEKVDTIYTEQNGISKNDNDIEDKFEISQLERKEKNYEDVSAEPVKKKKKRNKEKRFSGGDIPSNNEDAQSAKEKVDSAYTEQNGTNMNDNDVEASCRSSTILSSCEFNLLKETISEETLKAVEEMGFTIMTEIQAKSIPPLLKGKNLVGKAKTGSGKTLAFLIPAIERITKLNFKPTNGTGCIVITPTRELAMQIYGVLEELMKYHNCTYGLIMGGASRDAEVKKLQKGVNILIATPGRLLDHLSHTPRFMTSNLRCLVIDEADRILEIGFEEDLKEIISLLPEKRQTMLFSATNTKRTEDLTKLAIKKTPIYVEVQDSIQKATVDGLVQGYVVCPSEKRFLLLCTFLNKTQKKKRKVMVFFSSCLSVKYHDMIFNSIDLPVMSIHGKKEQRNRTATFFKFCSAESGILLCTDVAARGLDIPAVDWIIQYDPPDDPKEYIHRVGRTARGEGGIGRALLFLRPEEVGFLQYLKETKIPVEKFEFDWNKLLDIQLKLESMVNNDYDLREAAKEGFVSCARSYLAHHLKEVFDIRKLDLEKLARTFGLVKAPPVNLNINFKKLEKKMKKKKLTETPN